MIVLIVLVAKFTSAQDFPYHYFSHINSLINNPSLAAVSSDIKTDVGVYNLWAGGFKPLTDSTLFHRQAPFGHGYIHRHFDPPQLLEFETPMRCLSTIDGMNIAECFPAGSHD